MKFFYVYVTMGARVRKASTTRRRMNTQREEDGRAPYDLKDMRNHNNLQIQINSSP